MNPYVILDVQVTNLEKIVNLALYIWRESNKPLSFTTDLMTPTAIIAARSMIPNIANVKLNAQNVSIKMGERSLVEHVYMDLYF